MKHASHLFMRTGKRWHCIIATVHNPLPYVCQVTALPFIQTRKNFSCLVLTYASHKLHPDEDIGTCNEKGIYPDRGQPGT